MFCDTFAKPEHCDRRSTADKTMSNIYEPIPRPPLEYLTLHQWNQILQHF